MSQASGVYKQFSYKTATSAGPQASGSGGIALRRVSGSVNTSKDTYESQELRSDLQRADVRHGVRRATAQLQGELSPATYKDFFAGALKRDFAAVAAITGLSITISGSGPTYTLARASGSWLSGGIKVGMPVRLTAGSFAAGNVNKNLLVSAVTASNLTVLVLNGSALVAEGPIASATLTVPGKVTYTPQTGHVERYFDIEEWQPDVPSSITGYDLRVSACAINLPASGLARVQFDMMGRDTINNTTQRFTSPTAATTTGLTAAANGVVLYKGVAVAVITSLSINVSCNYTGDPVVGSNNIPALTPGRVIVKGSATIKFTDTAYRDDFENETEVDLCVVLTTANTAAADFLAFSLPRIKLVGAERDDGEKEIIQTVPFEALLNVNGGSGTASEYTTLMVHDSAA